MSVDPSNSDWVERALEATRHKVRKLEIDACRIRTDLARIEVANAVGLAPSDLVAPLCEEKVEPEADSPARSTSTLSALMTLPGSAPTPTQVSNGSADAVVNWQPAATSMPEGMDILVGAEAELEDHSSPASLAHIDDDPDDAKLALDSSNNERAREIYKRATSPVVASLVLHGAIVFLTASIAVATVDPDDSFGPTVLNLGGEPARESENIDPQQLADLGETSVQDAIGGSPQIDGIGPLERAPTPIDVRSPDGAPSPGQIGVSNFIPDDMGPLRAGMADSMRTVPARRLEWAAATSADAPAAVASGAKPASERVGAPSRPRFSAPRREATGLCL